MYLAKMTTAQAKTAFEKDNGADSRSIVNGIPLDIKNPALDPVKIVAHRLPHIEVCSVRRMISSCRERDSVVKRAL